MRKIFQAVAFDAQGVGYPPGGAGIELVKVVKCIGDAVQGGFRPDDSHWLGARWRCWLPLCEFLKPFADTRMVDISTCGVVRFGLSVEIRFVRFIGGDIEN